VERDKPKKIGIGWTNFSAVAMETKMGGLKKNLDSFWGGKQIQNGGRCHGNQGAPNVKFKPYSGSFWNTKIDHHSKLCSLFLKFSKWPPI
jgi:hypothetical protein